MSLPDFRPLTPQSDDSRRGASKHLSPNHVGFMLVASYDVVCVRGELMGVVLGACPVDEKGKPCPHRFDADASASFVLPSVRAKIEWGIGGASFLAFCDYRHGTQIGVIAENIRVCAEYVTSCCAFAGQPKPKCPLPCFQVSAGFGYGFHGQNSNSARLTEVVCLEEPGERVRVPIPPYASSLTAQPANDGACDLEVVGFCGSPRVIYEVRTPLSNGNQNNVENALPHYNGADSVIVVNRSAGPLVVFLIFGLAL